MRKLLANQVKWNELSAEYRNTYLKIEKCLNDDKYVLTLLKLNLNKESGNTSSADSNIENATTSAESSLELTSSASNVKTGI